MAEILLLEDEEDFANNLKQIMESEAHSVAHFREVTAALEHFELVDVDLVVADLFIKKDGQFERQGGLTLISTIRKIMGRDTPIIAMSGGFSSDFHRSPQMAMTAVESSKVVGANIALAKPFHPQELLDRIEELLGSVL
ncbi:MAG: response regulator [Pseudomonadota bacterium]